MCEDHLQSYSEYVYRCYLCKFNIEIQVYYILACVKYWKYWQLGIDSILSFGRTLLRLILLNGPYFLIKYI